MPPSYRLTYFTCRARAETSRLVLVYAGVPFEDKKVLSYFIDPKEWSEAKPLTPYGKLPILEVEDTIVLTQSATIQRYLAREFGLCGKTNLDSARIEEICDVAQDLYELAAKINFPPDESTREKLLKSYLEKDAPRLLSTLEKMKKRNSSSEFFYGSEVTLADLKVFSLIDLIKDYVPEGKELLENYECLKNHFEIIANIPSIKKYLSDRPLDQLFP